jgi:hypothetical protein
MALIESSATGLVITAATTQEIPTTWLKDKPYKTYTQEDLKKELKTILEKVYSSYYLSYKWLVKYFTNHLPQPSIIN